jgi:hypothetical protein
LTFLRQVQSYETEGEDRAELGTALGRRQKLSLDWIGSPHLDPEEKVFSGFLPIASAIRPNVTHRPAGDFRVVIFSL